MGGGVAGVCHVIVAAKLAVEKFLECVETALDGGKAGVYTVLEGVHPFLESVDSFSTAAETHSEADSVLCSWFLLFVGRLWGFVFLLLHVDFGGG